MNAGGAARGRETGGGPPRPQGVPIPFLQAGDVALSHLGPPLPGRAGISQRFMDEAASGQRISAAL